MKKFFLSILFLPTVAFAEPVTLDKSVVCDTIETVIKALTKEYGEQAIWVGEKEKSTVAVLVNTKTTSWTVIQFTENIACVLEEGEGFKIDPKVFDKSSIEM